MLTITARRRYLSLTGPWSETQAVREIIKAYGGRWESTTKEWRLPADPRRYRGLTTELAQHGAQISADADEWDIREMRNAADLVSMQEGRLHVTVPDKSQYRVAPYPFQEAGIQYLRVFDNGLLLDEMGLGKTYQAVCAANHLGLNVVVVCPNSLKAQWAEEWDRFSWLPAEVCVPDGPTERRARSIEASLVRRGAVDPPRPQVVILNYEALRYFPAQALAAARNSILILDEFHRCKSHKSQWTKLIAQADPARIWGLTGTPVANRPEDLFSLISLVRPGLVGWRWYQFEQNFIKRNHFGGISGYRNLDILTRELAKVSFGRKKSAVLDLPEKVFVRRTVELNPEESKAYKAMQRDMVAWLESELSPGEKPTVAQAASLGAKFTRLRQIADGFISEGAKGAYKFVPHPTKISQAVEVWDDAGRPRAVIWCQWIPTVLQTRDAFIQHVPAWEIMGAVDPRERQDIVKRWSETENAVLVCQMDTAGEGLNLQAASFEVFIDPPTTPRQRNQCVDRCHRIGQTEAVTVIDILAKGTVDEGLYRTLGQKVELAEEITSRSFTRQTREEILSRVRENVLCPVEAGR